MNIHLNKSFLVLSCLLVLSPVQADQLIDAYELEFEEKEQHTDAFKTRFLVTKRYLRIDDSGEDGGYVLYDNKQKKIYSVSHHDESILVIPQHAFTKPDLSDRIELHYSLMKDAPEVGGKNIYRYRLSARKDNEICMDIQLVPGLLPEVTQMLREYQKIKTGQQVRTLARTPDEYKTSCYLADQIFDDGVYYDKGMPIQEWHSNGKIRVLNNFKETAVNQRLFILSEDYRQFSLE